MTRRRRRRAPEHVRGRVMGHAWSRRGRRRATVITLSLIVLMAVAAVVTIFALDVRAAKNAAEEIQASIAPAKAAAKARDAKQITSILSELSDASARLDKHTHGPLWDFAAKVPWVESQVKPLMAAGTAMGDLNTAVIEPLSKQDLSVIGALPIHDGRIDPNILQPFVPILADAQTVIEQQGAALNDVDLTDTVDSVASGFVKLRASMTALLPAIQTANTLAPMVPQLLAAGTKRTYVVAFMNNAELRSLGGTALSFAEMTVDDGAIKFDRVVPAGDKNFPRHAQPVIPVTGGFDSIHPGTLGYFIAEATFRPSAVTAAEIVQAEWKAKFGENVDGVVLMDAGALKALLKAVGPVTLSTGDVVNSDNVLSLLFNEVYTRYNSGNLTADNSNQQLFYSETVSATFTKLTAGKFDPRVLFDSLQSASAGGDLSVWFTDPAEQSVFASTSFGATGLPESTPTTDVVGVYLNDQVGSKLNYYLGSTLTTGSATCLPDGRQVHRVSLALTSSLDPADVAGLSPSISGTYFTRLHLAKGLQRLVVFVYLPKGATLLSSSVDGKPVDATGKEDDGHPVQVLWVNVPPGGSDQLSVDLLMGTPGTQALVTDVTPTIQGTKKLTAPLDCATIKLP